MVRILNGIWNLEAQPLEIRTNGYHFVKNHSKSEQNIQILNITVLECLGPDPLKYDIQKVRISNDLGFWMVGFQIPAVAGIVH